MRLQPGRLRWSRNRCAPIATHSRLATSALALAATSVAAGRLQFHCQPPAATDARDRHHHDSDNGPTAAPTVTGESTTASIQIGDMLTYGSIRTTRHP